MAFKDKSENPRRITQRSHPDPVKAEAGIKVEAEYVDFESIKEDWSIWELSDGSKVRGKLSLIAVYAPLEPGTTEIIREADGSPRYGAAFSVKVVFEYSEKTFLAKEDS